VLYPKNGICYIIDSLGPNNERPYDDIMIETIEDNGLKPKFYPHSFQYLDSSQCGWFSIYVAKLINKNRNANPFKLVEDVFGNDADDSDIQKLIDGFGMNGNNLDKKYDLDVVVNGQGLLSHFQGITSAVLGTRMNIPPKMRKILKNVGDMKIRSIIDVGRIPINSMIQHVINGLSKQNNYDKLFHLFIVITLENGDVYRLEKNEQLNLMKWNKKPLKNETRIGLGIRGFHSLNSLINNAVEKFGRERLFKYRATSWNCQRFVLDILDASNIEMSGKYRNWILQNVKDLLPTYANKIANVGTDLKSKINLITEGYGSIL
jgi:hypothetical protein